MVFGVLVLLQDLDEYSSSGYQTDSQVDLPLDGDDYDDELEALMYADNSNNSRGRRGKRRQRGS